jgi:outer membrane protein TolC
VKQPIARNHMWSLSLFCLSLVLLVPSPVRGLETRGVIPSEGIAPGSQNDQRVDLASLVRELEEANPEIKATRQRWEAAKAVVPQVQTLPDPKLQVGYQQMPMVEPFQGAMYGLGQAIPFPGKLSLRGEVAQHEAGRLEQEYQAIRLRLIARLKEAYFDLHFVHKAIEIVERNKTLLTQFEKTAKARYSVGQAAQQDVFRAQVEISRVLDRLAVLDQQKESLHAAVNRLLNRPPAGPLGTPEESSHYHPDDPTAGAQPPRRRVFPRVVGDRKKHRSVGTVRCLSQAAVLPGLRCDSPRPPQRQDQ